MPLKGQAELDDKWQREQRDRFLVPFYQIHYPQRRFKTAHPSVDTVVVEWSGREVWIEEKIVRDPGYDYTAYTLETRSCTVPGREREGWMAHGEADELFYCFTRGFGFSSAAQNRTYQGRKVTLHRLVFQPLKTWFWDHLGAFMLTIEEDQINQTECAIVPIIDVIKAGFLIEETVLFNDLYDPYWAKVDEWLKPKPHETELKAKLDAELARCKPIEVPF